MPSPPEVTSGRSLRFALELRLRRGDELPSPVLDVAPQGLVSEQLRERDDRVALGPHLLDDLPLDVGERRALARVSLTAAAVREQAVVELVGGGNAAPLHGRSDAIDARGEASSLSMHGSLLAAKGPGPEAP